MYLDKLDGRIDAGFFDSKSAEWRAEQNRLLRDVETHQGANQTYIEEGVQLLRLAQRAHELFERQDAAEKRRLLSFLLSNCVWKAGVLTAEYRQPFDILALAREAGGVDEAMSGTENSQFEKWLPKTYADTKCQMEKTGEEGFSRVLTGWGNVRRCVRKPIIA
jgi:hypothetical protein